VAKKKLSKKAVVESLKEALGDNSPAVEMIIEESEKRNKHGRNKNRHSRVSLKQGVKVSQLEPSDRADH
jgi:hypothetical protein